MSSRALSPVLGVVLLLVVTVALAGVVATAALDASMPSSPPNAAVDLRVDADANRLTFVHRGGDALDVTAVTVRVRIDGTSLAVQPPVPFFSADGFRPGPTGPFNSGSGSEWTAGERTSFRLAGTNEPAISPEATVAVTLSLDGTVIAELEETA
ncbi:type IV pilin [Halorussus litoreus]|uniref:type IV pilin n=1 Tax=Halorussus litoreus TaxID=1710536 RepID=UPI000E260315|nr:type IV pilin [Halorussus litoreus]